MFYLIDVGINNNYKIIELVVLTNSPVSCFSCARSSSERQLAVGDKTKTVTCRKRIKADDVVIGAIFSLFTCYE